MIQVSHRKILIQKLIEYISPPKYQSIIQKTLLLNRIDYNIKPGMLIKITQNGRRSRKTYISPDDLSWKHCYDDEIVPKKLLFKSTV